MKNYAEGIRFVENENFNQLIHLVAECVSEGDSQEVVNTKVKELINTKFSDEEKDILKKQFKEYIKNNK